MATAVADVPEGLRPVAADPGAPVRFRDFRADQGLPAADLACEPLLPGAVLLCFRVWEGGERRWVDTTDLATWNVTASDLRASVTKAAAIHLEDANWVDIGGMKERYLQLADGDGWAVAGFLRPDLVSARLGGVPIRAAVPGEGVLLAWRAGSPDLEKVMAVGVRELAESPSGGLSPQVYQWSGDAWLPFGQAVPRVPEHDAPPG